MYTSSGAASIFQGPLCAASRLKTFRGAQEEFVPIAPRIQPPYAHGLHLHNPQLDTLTLGQQALPRNSFTG